MLDFELYVPTRMIFGRGRCDEVGRVIAGYGAAKPLVCYGGGSVVKSGLLERVERSLRQAGVDYALLGGVQANPTVDFSSKPWNMPAKTAVTCCSPSAAGASSTTQKWPRTA